MNIPDQLRARKYSVNRYFVDSFLEEAAGALNIERYCVDVAYVNIDASTEPDFLCDASYIPVADHSYDCVILTEVLEHVSHPEAV